MLNKENLQRAIDLVKTIPQEAFDMEYYRADISDMKEVECGTTGCIIGHCTKLDPDNVKYYLNKRGVIDFTSWSRDFFGLIPFGDRWSFMFDTDWSRSPETNTPEHALMRMTYVLEGYIPHPIELELKAYGIDIDRDDE